MQKLANHFLATTALMSMLLLPVSANPIDPNVVAGSATVAGQGTSLVVIDQSTDKAVIDWRSFNIGIDESTHFIQPNSQSVVLNRVTGGEGASAILGALKANGQVFLINPDGILFGKDATVDVGALVATTHGIRNADFMTGNYQFDQAGSAEASIVNLGTITVQDQGFAALVGPGVRNAGIIRANLGKIGLASADGFTLDFYGDELIKLAIDDTTAGTVVDLETGQTLNDLVSNSGLLSANGGTVQLTASAARAVVNSVINNTGNIEADTVGMQNGKIILGAATTATKPAGTPIQAVKVSGNLSVAGDEQGEIGGAAQITGELIELTVATIDAFGWTGGGRVLLGGDYMGGNGDPKTVAEYNIALDANTIPTASYLFADELTSISASALGDGNGGKVILWSDVATVTAAAIQAKGGALRGNGGFIETSGRYLSALTPADASAINGSAGWWLLDPLDIHLRRAPSQNRLLTSEMIYAGLVGLNSIPTASPSIIDIADAEFSLNAGTNLRVTTRGTVGGQPGDIYIEDDIRKTAGGDVFAIIDSARNVYFSSGIDLVSTSGKVFFHVYARNGKVFGSKVRVDVNGGQFLIVSSDVSSSLLGMKTMPSTLDLLGPQCLLGLATCVDPGSPVPQTEQGDAPLEWPVGNHRRISASFFDPTYTSISPPRQHLGVDVPAPAGTAVTAPVDGRIYWINIDQDDSYNSMLVIQEYINGDATGRYVVLGHIGYPDGALADALRSLPKDRVVSDTGNFVEVRAGQEIGKILPADGISTGSHLHLGLRQQPITRQLENYQNGQGGWGRAPMQTSEVEAQQRGWLDPMEYL